MKIKRVKRITDNLVKDFRHLMPQLDASFPPPTKKSLKGIISNKDVYLFIAEEKGKIIGTLTIVFYNTPLMKQGAVESFVVDREFQKKGVGGKMLKIALKEAKKRKVKEFHLTSNPKRIVANKLYLELGFKFYNTNVYKYYN